MVPAIHDARIVVVDDLPAIQRSLRRTLRAHGFLAVETFSDTEAALARHLQEPFDLALLDVETAGRSGVDLAEDLRAVDALLPVILLSGDSTGPLATQARRVADSFVEKPWDSSRLIETIRRLLFVRAYAKRFGVDP